MVIHPGVLTPYSLFHPPERHVVPRYQRRYVWNLDDQWEPFWEDLIALVEQYLEATNYGKTKIETKESPSHFLGTIIRQRESVFPGDMPTWRVIDGQQRITTIQLLLNAAKEEYAKNHAPQLGAFRKLVHNDAEEHPAVGKDTVNQFKVWPTRRDQDTFAKVMQGSEEIPGDGDILIRDAHAYFTKQIQDWFKVDEKLRKEKYQAFYEVVSFLLQMVVIDLDENADPQIIFETLNARGTPLSQSDLIKNWISYEAQNAGFGEESFHNKHLSHFEDSENDSENWWDTIVPQGRILRSRIDQFFNYYLAMRTEKEVLVGKVFNDFQDFVQERVSQNDTIEDIAVDIRRIADIYQRIERQEFEEPLYSFIDKRNILQAGVLTPPLLWLTSSDLSPDVLQRSLKALESFFIRRTLCRKSTMGLNRLMLELIAYLSRSSDSRVDERVVSFLAGQTANQRIWPGDEDLRSAFTEDRQFGVTAQRKLVMILKALNQRMSSPFTEIVDQRLSIEHVMPQKWRAYWPTPVDPERSPAEAITRRNHLIHTMGNLTLVTKSLNPSMSNGPWDKKRTALDEHSGLVLNKDLLKHTEDSQWDEAAIRARGKRLYEAALEVWPGPDAI